MLRTATTALFALSALGLFACGTQDTSSPSSAAAGGFPQIGGSGGASGSGGATASQSGGANASGGALGNGGGTYASGGSTSVGGAVTGGANAGGRSSSGGALAGGTPSIGGASATGGRTVGGASTAGGATSTGGRASGGAAAGGGVMGGASTGGGSASGGNTATGGAPVTGLDKFSFFVTSLAAMKRLSNNSLGFGGDLRYGQATGLEGADKICADIAESSLTGAGAKGWKAFLSTTTVNAIDRITYEGPYYDRLGRVVASSKTGLIATRPTGAESTILNDLPNEFGTPNHNPDGTGTVDNHDILTGSNASGKFPAGNSITCSDWTSNTITGNVPVGHSWIAGSGNHWIYSHNASGCKPGVTTGQSGSSGYVSSLGGYGAIYCIAMVP